MSHFTQTIDASTNGISLIEATNYAAMRGLIDIDGTLETFQRVRGDVRVPTARVTIMLDDGFTSAYTVAKPVFDAQGEVGAISMPSTFVNTAGCLTTAQLLALEAAGWEIASHSTTGDALTGMSLADARTALSTSKTALQALGLTVENFVYPSHLQNADIREITREYYRSARGTLVTLGANPPVLDTYALLTVLATDYTDGQLQAYVDAANAAGTWLIVYWHDVDGTQATRIGTLIDYVQSLSIPIQTMSEALDELENFIELGDYVGLNDGGARLGRVYGDVALTGDLQVTGSVGVNCTPSFPLDLLGVVDGTPTIRLKGLTTYCGIRIDTSSLNDFARNLFIGCNVDAYGDLVLRRSNALGGDPVAVGTNVLYFTPGGIMQLCGDVDCNGNTIYFGTAENTQTPTGTTATIDLGAENHHTLNCGSASGTVTLTLTVPPGPTAGTIIVIQGATARDITWTPSAGSVIWLGTEPTWSSDTSKTRIVSWRWNATNLYLSATDVNS
jgi:peptidoglycan/xylan/chitin deacetylase (PgdA/CDA1 family)